MEVAQINAMYFASRRHLAPHLAGWAALWPGCHWPTHIWPLPLLLLFLRYKSMDRIIRNKFPHSSLHPTRKVRVEKHAQRWCNHLWSQLRRATTLSSHATLSHTTLATTPTVWWRFHHSLFAKPQQPPSGMWFILRLWCFLVWLLDLTLKLL